VDSLSKGEVRHLPARPVDIDPSTGHGAGRLLCASPSGIEERSRTTLAHGASSAPARQIWRTDRLQKPPIKSSRAPGERAPPDYGGESKQLVLNGLPSMAEPGEAGLPRRHGCSQLLNAAF
jgi:hypothetical protein